MTTVFLIHCSATAVMVGVIWFVQLVHYPLFDRVEPAKFPRFEADHQAGTFRIVFPAMAAELVTGIWLCAQRPAAVPAGAAWLGLGLIAVNWASTFFVQVPLHRRLAGGFDAAAARRLVTTNWLRTFAWSLRGLLLFWLAGRLVRGA